MTYIAILILVLGVWYLLSEVGRQIVFRPKRKRWPLKLPFTPVHSGKLTGVYLPAKPGQATLLFFHGRGGNVSHFESFAATYAPLGYGILLFDYRGFGISKGVPCQKNVEQDALCAVRYALDVLKIAPENLVLYGHSLGNAPALFAAYTFADVPFKALVLQSPFLSTPDMAASWAVHAYEPSGWKYRFVRAFVTPFLYFNRFENTRLTGKLTGPVLVCFSKQDSTLPWQQSAKLADGISNVHRFLSPVGGHDEFSWTAQAVSRFLQEKSL